MRGSIYYQTSQLCKIIFEEGASKKDRVDSSHPYFQKVASFQTLKTYRNIWNNLLIFLKEHNNLKDCEAITSEHIKQYIYYKLYCGISQKYLEKIVSSLGKLQIALEHYSAKNGRPAIYDFSIRSEILINARKLKIVQSNYHNRAYDDPYTIINHLKNPLFKLAASIQLQGGTRLEGVALIQKKQLCGTKLDHVTKQEKGVIFTQEKGGKKGEILISIESYTSLCRHIEEYSVFKINRHSYAQAIHDVCLKLNVQPHGTHGFRWNFARRRLFEYSMAGYTHEQGLQCVSWEMKHNRAYITEHYLGG